VSGFAPSDVEPEEPTIRATPFLRKPFRAADLLHQVRSVLDA
jgi:hypothetical protein